jgi:hypothetical protein
MPLMPFTLKILNAFEMAHRAAACEIPAKYADHRAFVGIYPPMEDTLRYPRQFQPLF